MNEIQYHPNVLSFPIGDETRGKEVTDASGTWFKYDCWPNKGDYLLLTAKDGTELRFDIEMNGDSYVFRSAADGKLLPGEVTFTDDQEQNHWTEENKSYQVNVSYGGQSCVLGVYLEERWYVNTLKVTPSSKKISLKAKALKKKAKTLKPFTVKDAKGKVSYKVSVKGKSKKYLSFKKGKLTIKKGTKKGKYTMTVNVTAAGMVDNYIPMTKRCKITVTVK